MCLYTGGVEIKLRAMIDSGSPYNLISQDIIAQRGIPGDSENVPPAQDLNGTGEAQRLQYTTCHNGSTWKQVTSNIGGRFRQRKTRATSETAQATELEAKAVALG